MLQEVAGRVVYELLIEIAPHAHQTIHRVVDVLSEPFAAVLNAFEVAVGIILVVALGADVFKATLMNPVLGQATFVIVYIGTQQLTLLPFDFLAGGRHSVASQRLAIQVDA